MSIRFKKNVLKPENYNEVYRSEWTDQGVSYAVHYWVGVEVGENPIYNIQGFLDAAEQAQVNLVSTSFSPEVFVDEYKSTIKKLRKLGKIILA